MYSSHTSPEMSAPHQPDPVWGAQAPSQRWGLRQTAAAVGVAAVIAGIGGAAIYAAADGGSHTMGGGPHPGFAPGMPNGRSAPPPGAMAGPGPVAVGATSLHGEFVVSDGAGGYTTMLTQTGTVTTISATSITARSDDGYTQTYAMPTANGGLTPPFAVNDPVVIRATRTGQTATVTSIGNPDLGGPGASPHRN
jgi:hypothetical protein